MINDHLYIPQKSIVYLSSALSLLVGILVILGWHTQNLTLIQVFPQIPPMVYNTALSLIAAGIALFAMLKNNQKLSLLMGLVILFVGSLTFAEYIFDYSLGLDSLLFRVPPDLQSLTTGRMSPNGALSLCLMGIIILILSVPITISENMKRWMFVGMILSLIVLIINFVSIFGFITDMPQTYGWGSYATMGLHTAIMNFLINTCLMTLILMKAEESKFSFMPWLPWLVFVGVEVMALSFWQSSLAYVEKNINQQNMIVSQNIKSLIKDELQSRKETLQGMANRWKIRKGGTPYNEWYPDAVNIFKNQIGFQSVEWVDQQFVVRWVAPLNGNEKAVNFNLLKDINRSQGMLEAKKTGLVSFTPVINLQSGHKGFLIYVPIGGKDHFQGMIVGAVNIQEFFDEVFDQAVPNYNIAIYFQGKLVYQRNPHHTQTTDATEMKYVIHGIDWSLTSWPLPQFAKEQHSWLPMVVLFIGFCLAFMLSLITYLLQATRKNVARANEEIISRKRTEQQLILYSKKLRKQSLIDPLTGIDNRRALSSSLQEELSQLKDSENPLSIILIDIDHFKKINDTYGHVVGDAVLHKVGSILRKSTRSTDTVARYGGEEFCIVLPNCPDRQAYLIAEKLRVLIANQVMYCEKKIPFHITCSFGVYQVSSKMKKTTQVFKVVDGALYEAKNSGRNCVILV